ncbi:MauE/DoxX family redox-associated membrane protein [Nocardiopsis sp. NPDC049922]|uniref:MauE/DoxX family redox-associated membrane protein n=1 Tax=Nocardiopsis sp. NPDC049922 TaxID=3155157 RepID=UPI0033F43110
MPTEIVEAVREVQLPLLTVLLMFGAVAKTTTGAARSGLAVLLTERLRRPVTVASGLLEAVLAVGLIGFAGALGTAARAGTAALFAASVVVLLLARRRDPEAGCGCFGGLSRAPIGWRTLTRAGLLALAALSTLGLAPTGWTALTGFTVTHAVVLGGELVLLAALSPELRELAARLTGKEPCELRTASARRTMARLRSSDVWRTNRPVMLGAEPQDVWRHGCWRFLRYDGMRHGRRVDVVFAVRIGGRGRTAVRAALVDRESGIVSASFGAVTRRALPGPPRKLPRPRVAAKRDDAVRDPEREARALRAARAAGEPVTPASAPDERWLPR